MLEKKAIETNLKIKIKKTIIHFVLQKMILCNVFFESN
jgi:hypothetical protein